MQVNLSELQGTTVLKNSWGAAAANMASTTSSDLDQFRGVSHTQMDLIIAMAGLAFTWGGLVKEHALPVDRTSQLMTIAAGYVLMCALQGECGATVVIEIGGLPASGIVATGAVGDILASGKLPSVRIFVASRTLFRRGVEIDVLQCGFQIRRAVAIGTSHPAVRSDQRKIRF